MSKLKYVHNDMDFMVDLERNFNEYMGALWHALDTDEDKTTEISLTGDYFCGCDTCINRETFSYLIEHIIDGYKAGKFELNEEYKA